MQCATKRAHISKYSGTEVVLNRPGYVLCNYNLARLFLRCYIAASVAGCCMILLDHLLIIATVVKKLTHGFLEDTA